MRPDHTAAHRPLLAGTRRRDREVQVAGRRSPRFAHRAEFLSEGDLVTDVEAVDDRVEMSEVVAHPVESQDRHGPTAARRRVVDRPDRRRRPVAPRARCPAPVRPAVRRSRRRCRSPDTSSACRSSRRGRRRRPADRMVSSSAVRDRSTWVRSPRSARSSTVRLRSRSPTGRPRRTRPARRRAPPARRSARLTDANVQHREILPRGSCASRPGRRRDERRRGWTSAPTSMVLRPTPTRFAVIGGPHRPRSRTGALPERGTAGESSPNRSPVEPTPNGGHVSADTPGHHELVVVDIMSSVDEHDPIRGRPGFDGGSAGAVLDVRRYDVSDSCRHVALGRPVGAGDVPVLEAANIGGGSGAEARRTWPHRAEPVVRGHVDQPGVRSGGENPPCSEPGRRQNEPDDRGSLQAASRGGRCGRGRHEPVGGSRGDRWGSRTRSGSTPRRSSSGRTGIGLRITEYVDIDFGTEDRRGYERLVPNDFGSPTDVTASSPDADDHRDGERFRSTTPASASGRSTGRSAGSIATNWSTCSPTRGSASSGSGPTSCHRPVACTRVTRRPAVSRWSSPASSWRDTTCDVGELRDRGRLRTRPGTGGSAAVFHRAGTARGERRSHRRRRDRRVHRCRRDRSTADPRTSIGPEPRPDRTRHGRPRRARRRAGVPLGPPQGQQRGVRRWGSRRGVRLDAGTAPRRHDRAAATGTARGRRRHGRARHDRVRAPRRASSRGRRRCC